MSAASTFSKISGQSSVAQPCSRMSGPDAGGDVVVDRPDDVDLRRRASRMMCRAGVDQPLGVAGLGRALERAVDEQRLEVAEVSCVGHAGVSLSVEWCVVGSGWVRAARRPARRRAGPVRRRRTARPWRRRAGRGWSTRMPVAPHSSAYAAQSGLCSEVCQTGKSAASCSLLILPSAWLSSSTCLIGMPYLTAVVSSMRVLTEAAVTGDGDDRAARVRPPRRPSRPGSRSRSSRGSPTSAPAGPPTPGSGPGSRRGCRRRR